MCVRVCTAELHFSAVNRNDFDRKFRCKIKNPYTDVDVISSTDSIVRLDSNLPEGRLFASLVMSSDNINLLKYQHTMYRPIV